MTIGGFVVLYTYSNCGWVVPDRVLEHGSSVNSKKETYMSFADFKKRSRSSIDELTKKIEETNKKESYTDDRFWRPELDKSSNG